ncbi:MAG: hypothetical protein WBA25_08815 [Jannaschia sp.]
MKIMAWDYLAASQFLNRGVDDNNLRLSAGAVPQHCASHGVELAIKSLLLSVDVFYDPKGDGHDLVKLRAQVLDRPEVLNADTTMLELLGKLEHDSITDLQGVRVLGGQTIDHSIGSSHGITPEMLFKWYGVRHRDAGGWFRYPKERLERTPTMWVRTEDGRFNAVQLLPLALEYWLEAFLNAIEVTVHSEVDGK